MKQVRVPSLLGNLFRDLRDRRLLIPAIALVVALFAVPIVLKSHSSSSATPSAPVADAGARADQAVPAVVTQQLGVTNYRKRLNQLQSKNPFHQQYTATPEGAQLNTTSTGTDSSSTSSTTGTSTTSSTGSVPPVSTVTPPSGGTSPSPGPPVETSSGGSNSAAPHHHTNPGSHYYAWRISVKVGEPGQLKARSEVQRLAMLPSDHKPVATFIGASEDGSRALFLVSSDVDSVKGDGRCLPSHASCQYLVMKTGDKANLHYAPDGKRYNIVLVDIHPVDVTDKLPKKASRKAQSQQRLPLLGDG